MQVLSAAHLPKGRKVLCSDVHRLQLHHAPLLLLRRLLPRGRLLWPLLHRSSGGGGGGSGWCCHAAAAR